MDDQLVDFMSTLLLSFYVNVYQLAKKNSLKLQIN
jgi:hypothetical protein